VNAEGMTLSATASWIFAVRLFLGMAPYRECREGAKEHHEIIQNYEKSYPYKDSLRFSRDQTRGRSDIRGRFAGKTFKEKEVNARLRILCPKPRKPLNCAEESASGEALPNLNSPATE